MSDELLVFPVGHELGPFHPGPGKPPSRRQIRVGRTIYGLPSPEEHRVWALAHGSAGEPPLSWQRYRERLHAAELPDAATVAGRLAADGLLCRVPPAGKGAVEFAERHRVMPLMTAVGVTEKTPPGRYSIGVFGRPVVHVEELAFWLWCWGHQWDSLWQACVAAAADPEALLTGILSQLHQLLSASAAYLDAAWDRR